jgi:hypothetical protein
VANRTDRNGSSRATVFITHAAPEDNDFALWLSSKLAIAGYKVWVDWSGSGSERLKIYGFFARMWKCQSSEGPPSRSQGERAIYGRPATYPVFEPIRALRRRSRYS